MANCRYCQGSNEDGRCTEVRKGPEDCQGNQMVQAGGLREDATGSVGGSLGRLGGGGGGWRGEPLLLLMMEYVRSTDGKLQRV